MLGESTMILKDMLMGKASIHVCIGLLGLVCWACTPIAHTNALDHLESDQSISKPNGFYLDMEINEQAGQQAGNMVSQNMAGQQAGNMVSQNMAAQQAGNMTGTIIDAFTNQIRQDQLISDGHENADQIDMTIQRPCQSLRCDDGNACNGVEACDPMTGTCLGGIQLLCDDGNACNGIESCDPITGCVSGEVLVCDDGNACNGIESCDSIAGCVSGEVLVCDDGNACNGLESCDPMMGCVAGEPLVCDDGDGCNGIESCDPMIGCVATQFGQCAYTPDSCANAGGVGRARANVITQGTLGNIGLKESGFDDDRYHILDELAISGGNRYVNLLSRINLNRQAQRVRAWTNTPCFAAGFTWNDGDNAVRYWYPQGITGSNDTAQDQLIDGQKYLIVSWFNNTASQAATDPNRGARISLINITDFNNINYRHILLVTPKREMDGTANYDIANIHAGGIFWYGHYLYVVETGYGFRVYDLNKIIYVPAIDGIGKQSDGRFGSYGYQYILPEVGRYRKCPNACCARYSFGALDRSTTPHSVITGAYSDQDINGVAYRWQLGENGKLLTEQGVTRPIESIYMGVGNMQGMMSYDGRLFAASSFRAGDGEYSPDHLYFGQMNQRVTEVHVPRGIEDLYFQAVSQRVWSLTEHPSSRVVFSMNLDNILNGCP